MDIEALPITADVLGESPLWHPREQVLYWCDIPGRRLNRFDPASGTHTEWPFDEDLGCCAALESGGLLVAERGGIWRLDPSTAARELIAEAPYDGHIERFNDGKVDAQGRFWLGTIYEPRTSAKAALYRLEAGGALTRCAGGITTSNGLAFSPDGRTMYWADTRAHTVYALDMDLGGGLPTNRRVFARFAARDPNTPIESYQGRPDGATVDSEGAYWVSMFEGARLLRLSPSGELLQTVHLPVRCPTMPCFGDADLKTIYVTTSREKRPADELAAMPLSGRVLRFRVDVPGLPANLVTTF